MPVVLPTPDELERMPWRARQRARAQARALLLAVQASEHRCYHGSDRPSASTLAARLEWARQVRAEARRLERVPVWDASPDPDAAAHVAALLEAIA